MIDSVQQGVRRVVRAIASAPPWSVLLASWLLVIIYAYPGLMTLDSMDHLTEARGGDYTDSHPPAINVLWKAADFIVAGPLGMLVFQCTTFLVGLYCVLRRTLAPRHAAWAASIIFLFPPVSMPFAVIWKDCVMAGLLMLGLAAMPASCRWVRLAGLLALGAATAVRYNAFGATLPIVVLMFEWRTGMHWLKRYAIACVAWLAVTFGAFTFNAQITDQHMYPWHATLALYDIVGTLAHVDGELSDAELRELLRDTELRTPDHIQRQIHKLYSTRDFLPIITHGDDAMWQIAFRGTQPPPPARRAAISRAFVDVITTYPLAYAKHRLDVMAEVLCLTSYAPSGTIPNRGLNRNSPWLRGRSDELGLTSTWSTLQLKLSSAARWLDRTTPVFVPWIYLAISLLLLPLALRHRAVLATLLSGLVVESSLLFLAASPDYRYSHWMVICTLVAVVELTALRMRKPAATP